MLCECWLSWKARIRFSGTGPAMRRTLLAFGSRTAENPAGIGRRLDRSREEGAMTAEKPVLVERAPEGYAVLTLNRPEAMNALSAALRRALAEAVAQLAADPSVRVLVLTGAAGPSAPGWT
jgi:Enoyl-CoA hydratase/isomerase